eukprot:COSAG02_NODE_8379_length_2591_cov_16.860754_2_plen_129_part_01
MLQSDLLLVDHCVAVRCDLIGWLQLHLRVVLVWTDIRYGLDHTQLQRLRARTSFEHTAAFHASYDRLMTDLSGGEHVLPRCVDCVVVLSCATVRFAGPRAAATPTRSDCQVAAAFTRALVGSNLCYGLD